MASFSQMKRIQEIWKTWAEKNWRKLEGKRDKDNEGEK